MQRTTIILGLLFFACIASMGCQRLTFQDHFEALLQGKANSQAAGADETLQVKVDGANVALGVGQVAATKSADFLPQIEKMQKAARLGSLRELVQRQPDTTMEVLRTELAKSNAAATVVAMAETYDRQMGIPAGQGWQAVFPNGLKQSAVRDFSRTQQKLLAAISQGKIPEHLVKEVSHHAESCGIGVLKLEAYRSQAIARLLMLQPQLAAERLQSAVQLAASIDPYQQIQLQLLLSDALRRQGKAAEANQAWLDSVNKAARLAVHRPVVFDPVYWDKASYQRPIQVEWPETVAQSLFELTPLERGDETSQGDVGHREAIVWGAIGQSLLDRGDHDAALLALKRAESSTTSDTCRGWLRIAEANTLARLGQASAATAILVSLTSQPDAKLSAAATVSLGSIKLAAGDATAGYRLLRKGFDPQLLQNWPGIADAEADFGLASLMHGDEAVGLPSLHSAQGRFGSQAETLRLVQCLTNEADYMRLKKNKPSQQNLMARISELER